jgi:hypothetical protein
MNEIFDGALIIQKEKADFVTKVKILTDYEMEPYFRTLEMGGYLNGLIFSKKIGWRKKDELWFSLYNADPNSKKGSFYVHNEKQLALARIIAPLLEENGYEVTIVKAWLPKDSPLSH